MAAVLGGRGPQTLRVAGALRGRRREGPESVTGAIAGRRRRFVRWADRRRCGAGMDLRRGWIWVAVWMLWGAASSAQAPARRFETPMLDGHPLSYCDAGGRRCGEAVATPWCGRQGYGYASEWRIRRGSGFASQARRLDDGSSCRGAGCDSFAEITCAAPQHGHRYLMPSLGAAGRSTVISPDQRNADTAVRSVEYHFRLTGCRQRAAGAFVCDTLPAYHRCRKALEAGRVFACRANRAFLNQAVRPQAVAPGDYALRLNSTASATVYRGRRGKGKLKGEARFEIRFSAPKINKLDWCVERERYVYHPTGPQGGTGKVDDREQCKAPIEGRLVPQHDDLLAAYDACRRRDAWGRRLRQPMEILVAGLYHIGSARPNFVPGRAADHTEVLAPYVVLKAPMSVTCKR